MRYYSMICKRIADIKATNFSPKSIQAARNLSQFLHERENEGMVMSEDEDVRWLEMTALVEQASLMVGAEL